MDILKRNFAVARHPVYEDAALLLIRVVVGIAFVIHGWAKAQNPFGWMGPEGFAPGIFQALAALSEFGGGMAWIVGLLTRLAGLGIGCTMTVAFLSQAIMAGAPFVSKTGGPALELPAVYFCVAILLIAMGPGRFSLDRLVFGTWQPSAPREAQWDRQPK